MIVHRFIRAFGGLATDRLKIPVQLVQVDIRRQRADHAPYNIAKMPLDFTVSIARKDLKGHYGEGFGGAPLRTASPSRRTAIGDGGGRHEQEAT